MFTKMSILNAGSPILPLASDVSYLSAAITDDAGIIDVYVEFYDTSGNPVTPTNGRVFIYGMPMGKNWLHAVGSPIEAIYCNADNSNYSPPMLDGLCEMVKARFLGVVGATSASVTIYKR